MMKPSVSPVVMKGDGCSRGRRIGQTTVPHLQLFVVDDGHTFLGVNIAAAKRKNKYLNMFSAVVML